MNIKYRKSEFRNRVYKTDFSKWHPKIADAMERAGLESLEELRLRIATLLRDPAMATYCTGLDPDNVTSDYLSEFIYTRNKNMRQSAYSNEGEINPIAHIIALALGIEDYESLFAPPKRVFTTNQEVSIDELREKEDLENLLITPDVIEVLSREEQRRKLIQILENISGKNKNFDKKGRVLSAKAHFGIEPFTESSTLETIANILGISIERTRQKIESALEKIREHDDCPTLKDLVL